jgi:glycosyltransferase involved in cell wall biosynthesis
VALMSVPTVSVIIPCRNEERHIASCLESVLATDYPRDRVEVVVVDGMSSDRTREIVARYAAGHPSIRLIDNPQGTAPAAMNAGIRRSTGEIVARVDAHATVPPDYLPVLVDALQRTGADNAGALLVTLPADATPTARAIALALSHRFGVGNSHFRIGSARRRWVDTVPFGCYRRETFDRIGLFDEELVRNQDDELNLRLISRGGRILLVPETRCYYYARRSLGHVGRMCYQYGYFKPLVARKVGRIMTVRQLIPALFVLGLVVTMGLSALWPLAGRAGAAVLLTYLLLALGCAAAAARTHGPRCALVLAMVFPLVHTAYGAGFLHGVWTHVLRTRGVRPHAATVPLSR